MHDAEFPPNLVPFPFSAGSIKYTGRLDQERGMPLLDVISSSVLSSTGT